MHMSASGSSAMAKQSLDDSAFLLCCIDAIFNGEIDFAAVAKAVNYANEGRARARLSRIDSRHKARPQVSRPEGETGGAEELDKGNSEAENEDSLRENIDGKIKALRSVDSPAEAKEIVIGAKKNKRVQTTSKAPIGSTDGNVARVTRSSTARALAASDVKTKKNKPAS
ncbi:hypothetical protein TWF730_009776 [Orbilia blumenaviensis]|uniref:Myb-like DNA-binding domain-containing protein n=1 Tax=Orbilia blumenaviensis TaxID=1796055 RepID=A0AAV9UVX2_9PEZI